MLRRQMAVWAALALVASCSVLCADTVVYQGDAPGSGPNATFTYQVTVGSGGVLTSFTVTVWPGAKASDFTNLQDPTNWTSSFVQDVDPGTPGNQPGIVWDGTANPLMGGSVGVFGFQNMGGWVSQDAGSSTWFSDSGSGPNSGTIRGPVPEPATLLLFGSGLLGLAALRRRQARK